MRKVIFLSVAVAILAAFLASSNPDGLEKVAENLGFIEKGIATNSIMTDYAVPFVPNAALSTAAAGIIGTLLTFGIFWATVKLSGKIK